MKDLNEVQDISELADSIDTIENNTDTPIDENTVVEEPVSDDVVSEETGEEPEEVEESVEEEVEEEVDFTDILKQYGLEDGKIQFEDSEEPVDFNELNYQDQVFVLKQLLVNSQGEEESEDSSVESSLSDEEIDLLNTLRTSGQSIDEYITSLAPQSQEVYDSISEFDSDSIFKYDYLVNLPEEDRNAMSDEEVQDLLETELELAKQSNTFDSRMNKLKERYVEEENQEQQFKQQQQIALQQQELEETKKEFVQKTANLNEIGAFNIDNDIKEDIYSKVLEIDNEGLSQFDRLIQSDPVAAFKAVYYAFYGEQNEETLIKGFQDEMKKKVSEAKKSAVEGFPSRPITKDRSSNSSKSNNETTTVASFRNKDSVENLKSIDDLHAQI